MEAALLAQADLQAAQAGAVRDERLLLIAQEHGAQRQLARAGGGEGEAPERVRDGAVDGPDDEHVHADQRAVFVGHDAVDAGLGMDLKGGGKRREKEGQQLFHVAKVNTKKRPSKYPGQTSRIPDQQLRARTSDAIYGRIAKR